MGSEAGGDCSNCLSPFPPLTTGRTDPVCPPSLPPRKVPLSVLHLLSAHLPEDGGLSTGCWDNFSGTHQLHRVLVPGGFPFLSTVRAGQCLWWVKPTSPTHSCPALVRLWGSGHHCLWGQSSWAPAPWVPTAHLPGSSEIGQSLHSKGTKGTSKEPEGLAQRLGHIRPECGSHPCWHPSSHWPSHLASWALSCPPCKVE